MAAAGERRSRPEVPVATRVRTEMPLKKINAFATRGGEAWWPQHASSCTDKAMSLSADVEDNFLDLGKTLRQLLDRDPDAFAQVRRKSNLGRRKAYYLVEVSRIFDPLPIARSRLKTIGWTKLQLLGKQIDKGNAQELLELA
jgi:hypothetical protein